MNLRGILLLGNDRIIPKDPREWGNIWINESQVKNHSGGSSNGSWECADETSSSSAKAEAVKEENGGGGRFVSERVSVMVEEGLIIAEKSFEIRESFGTNFIFAASNAKA